MEDSELKKQIFKKNISITYYVYLKVTKVSLAFFSYCFYVLYLLDVCQENLNCSKQARRQERIIPVIVCPRLTSIFTDFFNTVNIYTIEIFFDTDLFSDMIPILLIPNN